MINPQYTRRLKRLMVFVIASCSSFFCLNVQAVNCSNLSEWNSATAYSGGAQVKQSGKAYKANWWSQGHSPASYSGQWQEWTLLGSCDGTTASSVKSSSSKPAASSSKSSVKSSAASSKASSSVAGNDCGAAWYRANLTNYESYPAPGSDECVIYNGCMWSGYFYGISGKQPESWVMANNIAAVHLKDWSWLGNKTLNLRQGSKRITVKAYDACSDSDCDGCCTANLAGDGYLIDLEKYTMQRFGSGSGIVEFQVCN
jgi:chitodextrinase